MIMAMLGDPYHLTKSIYAQRAKELLLVGILNVPRDHRFDYNATSLRDVTGDIVLIG